MVRGEKEYLCMFFEVAICLYLCSPLVRVSLLFKCVFGSIVTWFNADKWFVIRAGTKRKAIKQDYTIHNHILEVVEESKYLGVTISKDLTWNEDLSMWMHIPMWVLPL
jgi:hypothetical protein